MNSEVYENITALVDNEIKEKERRETLRRQIENNEDLKFEFEVQQSVKSLLKERFADQKAPEFLKAQVLESIKSKVPEKQIAQPKSSDILTYIKRKLIYPKAKLAFGTIILLILSTLLFKPFSDKQQMTPSGVEKAELGNLLFEAKENFKKIIDGTLKFHIESSNPNEIYQFFQNAGVGYNVAVPEFKDWDLAGAVVSEAKGKKLAHQIYQGRGKEILYLYQVSNDYCDKSIVKISEEIFAHLKTNPFYKLEEKDRATYIWKSKGNVYALVTNEKCERVEKDFLTSFIAQK